MTSSIHTYTFQQVDVKKGLQFSLSRRCASLSWHAPYTSAAPVTCANPRAGDWMGTLKLLHKSLRANLCCVSLHDVCLWSTLAGHEGQLTCCSNCFELSVQTQPVCTRWQHVVMTSVAKVLLITAADAGSPWELCSCRTKQESCRKAHGRSSNCCHHVTCTLGRC